MTAVGAAPAGGDGPDAWLVALDRGPRPSRLLCLAARIYAQAAAGATPSSPSAPDRRALAIVKAATHFRDPQKLLEASEELGEAMPGLDVRQMEQKDLLSTRGW